MRYSRLMTNLLYKVDLARVHQATRPLIYHGEFMDQRTHTLTVRRETRDLMSTHTAVPGDSFRSLCVPHLRASPFLTERGKTVVSVTVALAHGVECFQRFDEHNIPSSRCAGVHFNEFEASKETEQDGIVTGH